MGIISCMVPWALMSAIIPLVLLKPWTTWSWNETFLRLDQRGSIQEISHDWVVWDSKDLRKIRSHEGLFRGPVCLFHNHEAQRFEAICTVNARVINYEQYLKGVNVFSIPDEMSSHSDQEESRLLPKTVVTSLDQACTELSVHGLDHAIPADQDPDALERTLEQKLEELFQTASVREIGTQHGVRYAVDLRLRVHEREEYLQ